MCNVRLYLTAVSSVQKYPLPPWDVGPPGALDAAVQVFFSALDVEPPAHSADGWLYKPAPRKSRVRARRGRRAAPPLHAAPPLEPSDAAYWELPPESGELGAEVLTTPVPRMKGERDLAESLARLSVAP